MGSIVEPQYDRAHDEMWLEFSFDIANDEVKLVSDCSKNVTKGTELLAAEMELPATFELLYESDIWVCNTGASSHSTNNDVGATNVQNSGKPSL